MIWAFPVNSERLKSAGRLKLARRFSVCVIYKGDEIMSAKNPYKFSRPEIMSSGTAKKSYEEDQKSVV